MTEITAKLHLGSPKSARARLRELKGVRFGKEVEEILAILRKSGPLFPCHITVRPGDRATEFKQRCAGLNIEGVRLHS